MKSAVCPVCLKAVSCFPAALLHGIAFFYVHTHRACQNTGDHNRCHCLIPADTAVTDDFPGITVISILTRLHSLFHIVTYIFQKNLGSCRKIPVSQISIYII